MAEKIKWGIMSTGGIAENFARSITPLENAELAAIGSRYLEKADAFAEKYGAKRAYGSYQELAEDGQVDIIYVATPHTLHCENTLMCLDAGRAVLCEKPFAVDSAQAERMVRKARDKKIFLMEAMWTRFLPVMKLVRSWIDEGRIGDVRMVRADFGEAFDDSGYNWRLDNKFAGGALLDLGVYPITMASMVFGSEPKDIRASADVINGIDEQTAMILSYDDNRMAVLDCSVKYRTGHHAIIHGTKGMIKIYPPFFGAVSAGLLAGDEDEQIAEFPHEGGRNGHSYQAEAAMADLIAGRTENETMSLDETLRVMKIMDTVREIIGLEYDV